MLSIFGSEENSKFLFFKLRKFPILLKKSSMPFLLKTFDKESIGFKCFIFLNLFDGGEPTIFVFNFNSFKYLYLFSNEKISNFNLSKSESEIIGLSSLKYKLLCFFKRRILFL